jgi:predicted AlkP superfamily phosphohydrolase/phosphomutase
VVSRSIVAIGLDAADHALIEKWSADGHLPNLARLRRRGSYGTLQHIEFYSDETPWTNFLTGYTPQRTGFWSPFRFSPETYEHKFGPYDFSEFRPFYALNEQRSICVFDMPHCPVLFPGQDGVQVLVWGSHSAMAGAATVESARADHGAHQSLWGALGAAHRIRVGSGRTSAILSDSVRR